MGVAAMRIRLIGNLLMMIEAGIAIITVPRVVAEIIFPIFPSRNPNSLR